MAGLKNTTFLSDHHREWTQVLGKTIQTILIYYGLFLVVMGCVCNPLSFIVLSRKKFRSSNLSVHLRILCASDLGNLLNMFCNVFMQRAFAIDLSTTQAACRFSIFCGHFFLFLSSWILVIVTAERVVSIHRPHRYHLLCSQTVVKGVLATTIVILGLISLLPVFTYEDTVIIDTRTNTTTVIRCQAVIKENVLHIAQMIITILLFALLPSLLLIIFNILIIVGVVRSRKSVMRRSNVTAEVTSNATTSTTDTTTSTQRKTFQHPGQTRISRREASLTKTVLAINITFILCNFPSCAFGASVRNLTGDMGELGLALNDLLLMLVYTNNVMNFILYCVTGTKFRNEVKALFDDIIHGRRPI